MTVRSLGWEAPLEEGTRTHSSSLTGEFYGQWSLAGYCPGGRTWLKGLNTQTPDKGQWLDYAASWVPTSLLRPLPLFPIWSPFWREKNDFLTWRNVLPRKRPYRKTPNQRMTLKTKVQDVTYLPLESFVSDGPRPNSKDEYFNKITFLQTEVQSFRIRGQRPDPASRV